MSKETDWKERLNEYIRSLPGASTPTPEIRGAHAAINELIHRGYRRNSFVDLGDSAEVYDSLGNREVFKKGK